MNKNAIAIVTGLVILGVSSLHSISAAEDPFSVEINDNHKAAEGLKSVEIVPEGNGFESIEEINKEGFPVNGTVEGSGLRFRKWPWGPVCGQYNIGDSVVVTGESGEFYAVTINGVEGYMHKNYISIPSVEASRKAPYYPGSTASGGYLEKEVGITFSNSSKTKVNSTPFIPTTFSTTAFKTPKLNLTLNPFGKESTALKNYTGGKLQPEAFINTFGPAARDSMKVTGVPASVTLAQAILETGWGSSSIGNAKNLFGIKGTGPAGAAYVPTTECYNGKWVTINDNFRKYNTWEQSISDHASLLSSGRYASAFNTYSQNKNANQFAYNIHKAGYATDPKYGSKLVDLMQSYNLYKWDC